MAIDGVQMSSVNPHNNNLNEWDIDEILCCKGEKSTNASLVTESEFFRWTA